MKFFVTTLFILYLSCGYSITISSNGNSPERKMLSIDKKNVEFGGFVPINPTLQNNNLINAYKKHYLNDTQLPVNERYRRLIPYMIFYLANDFNSPQNDQFISKVQYQKVPLTNQVQSGKVPNVQYNEIPRYQGNRLSQFNIASAYPGKIIQDYLPKNQHIKFNQAQLPIMPDNKYHSIHSIMRAPPPKHLHQSIPVPVKVPEVYSLGEVSSLEFYTKPTEETYQQYKLVPYEQTPPVPVQNYEHNYFTPIISNNKKAIPVPVSIDTFKKLNSGGKLEKPFTKYTVSPQIDIVINGVDSYNTHEENKLKQTPEVVFPTTETGFKPIIPTTSTKYAYVTPATYTSEKASVLSTPATFTTRKPYYKVAPLKKPVIIQEPVNYGPSSGDIFEQNNLAKILKSLQNSNSLPQTITAENVDTSIKTLVQILNRLKDNQKDIDTSSIRPVLSTPIPFQTTGKPITNVHSNIVIQKQKLQPIKPPVNIVKTTVTPVHEYPSQDLEIEHVVEQPGFDENNKFPESQNDIGGTPGRPGVDYPALSSIPTTSFDCKTQRYKGFFGDPETNCQVWHYCDLNGGQASFLCPNGTIFSQAALTCDWWFNVKCSSTAQLYVLNERLYKYILPYSPKFPEDYSGPLVDKYLSIKYKELEEKMKKKKKVSKPETTFETEKAEVIEIKTSGMSGALKPYENEEQ